MTTVWGTSLTETKFYQISLIVFSITKSVPTIAWCAEISTNKVIFNFMSSEWLLCDILVEIYSNIKSLPSSRSLIVGFNLSKERWAPRNLVLPNSIIFPVQPTERALISWLISLDVYSRFNMSHILSIANAIELPHSHFRVVVFLIKL